jgi:transglutaminase-like putative cysteine protease
MRIAITHATTYHYDGPPAHTVQALRLVPPGGPGQRILSWRVEAPGIETAASYTDAFGNLVRITASRGEGAFEVVARGLVETTDTGGVAGRTDEAAPPALFRRATPATAASDAISALARRVDAGEALGSLHNLMGAVHREVAYVLDATTPRTTAAAAFAERRGVCQDHAHVMIAAARCLGIPSRYLTGYLLLDDGGADTSVAQHAWMEGWITELGWVGFDAANNLCPTDRYVRLTVGLDAASAAPIRGIRGGAGAERMEVAVAVALSDQ